MESSPSDHASESSAGVPTPDSDTDSDTPMDTLMDTTDLEAASSPDTYMAATAAATIPPPPFSALPAPDGFVPGTHSFHVGLALMPDLFDTISRIAGPPPPSFYDAPPYLHFLLSGMYAPPSPPPPSPSSWTQGPTDSWCSSAGSSQQQRLRESLLAEEASLAEPEAEGSGPLADTNQLRWLSADLDEDLTSKGKAKARVRLAALDMKPNSDIDSQDYLLPSEMQPTGAQETEALEAALDTPLSDSESVVSLTSDHDSAQSVTSVDDGDDAGDGSDDADDNDAGDDSDDADLLLPDDDGILDGLVTVGEPEENQPSPAHAGWGGISPSGFLEGDSGLFGRAEQTPQVEEDATWHTLDDTVEIMYYDGDDDGVDDDDDDDNDDDDDVTIIADVGAAARIAELVDDSADGGVGAADGQGGGGHAINFGGYESDTEWDADNGEEDSGSNQYGSRES
jgi:hypothetical protein